MTAGTRGRPTASARDVLTTTPTTLAAWARAHLPAALAAAAGSR